MTLSKERFKMRLALLALTLITLTIAACAPAATPVPTAAPTPTSLPTRAATAASPAPTSVPAAATTSAPKPVVQVEAQDDFFRPQNITVTVGTLVTWTNIGNKKHTVTNDTLFDSDILVGQSFSYTFDKPGTYQYYCVVHSESATDGMVGTVTVVSP
jgi:plastocyanin